MDLPPRCLRNKLGNPVAAEDFWPRPVVEDLLGDLVEERGSRRLFALRRIGKTSVLLELERRLREHADLTVIRIDVQGISRFKDFLDKLFEQIPSEGRLQQVRQKIATNSVMQSLLPVLWSRVTGSPPAASQSGFQNEFDHKAAWAGDIESALAAAGPIVLILDELPYMLRNMMREGYKSWDVERFLATLRTWRMNCGVRMLLSGSIGLAQLARIDHVNVADHIGDVIPVKLPPLPPAEAVMLVDALAQGDDIDGWSRALSEAIVEASAETWPIFLQYGFAEVAKEIAKSGLREPAQVRAIIDAGVRQRLDETFYQQFATRLSRYGADEKAARQVLRIVVAASAAERPQNNLGPHPEERAPELVEGGARLEGWQHSSVVHPSCETRPSAAPQDEVERHSVPAATSAAKAASMQALDDALAKISAADRRDDLIEALREDDFIVFDTEAQTVRPASKLVPIWVRARSWGR